MTQMPSVMWFEDLGRGDVALVGGKNASLGEMVRHLGARGVRIPAGFATTAQAYWQFVDANGLREVVGIAFDDLRTRKTPLVEVGSTIRRAFLRGTGRTTLRGPSHRPTGRFADDRAKPMRTSRCARAPPRRTCPTRASPASRRAFSTSAARPRCSTPAAAALPRSLPTARSATGRSKASTT